MESEREGPRGCTFWAPPPSAWRWPFTEFELRLLAALVPVVIASVWITLPWNA